MNADFPAWVTVVLILLLPLLIKPVRANIIMLAAVFCIIVVRHILAVYGSYISPLKATESDALVFHRAGAELAESGEFFVGIGADFYENFLGVVYALFGTSRLLGSETSILAFTLAVLFLYAIIAQLGQQRYATPLVLIYSMLPMTLIATSTTLREAWQVLFLMGSVYWGLRYRQDDSYRSFAMMAACALAMALFHKALILYSVVLVACFYLWPRDIKPASEVHWSRKAASVSLFLVIVASGFWFIAEYIGADYGGDVVSAVVRGELLGYIAYYHEILNAQAGRAGYEVLLDTSSWGRLIKTWLLVYLQYLFSPLPWQVENMADAYAFFEAVMRAVLLVSAFYVSLRAMRERQYDASLLVCLYLSMTALWSIGTANYGQAIRHHLLTNWMLLVVVGPFMLGAIAQVWRRSRQ